MALTRVWIISLQQLILKNDHTETQIREIIITKYIRQIFLARRQQGTFRSLSQAVTCQLTSTHGVGFAFSLVMLNAKL